MATKVNSKRYFRDSTLLRMVAVRPFGFQASTVHNNHRVQECNVSAKSASESWFGPHRWFDFGSISRREVLSSSCTTEHLNIAGSLLPWSLPWSE